MSGTSTPGPPLHVRLWAMEHWRAWVLGGLLCIASQWLWFGGYFTWFFGALCHEIGHSAVAIATGHLSLPVIRLDGHAAAVSGEQNLWLALLMLALPLVGAWQTRDRATARNLFLCLFGTILLLDLWPWLGEVTHLYGGVLGELTFSAIFLWRSFTGGFTEAAYERPLYAFLGWLLVWENLTLSVSLIFSEQARTRYASGGSFGLANDLVRVAEDYLGTGLQAPALILLVMTIATPLLVWWIGKEDL